MATAVFMPKLSMAMETGTILQWFKKEGDYVREGEPILEVLTDKINIEVESYVTGTLLKILYEKDAEVEVNKAIGWIGEAGEAIPDAADAQEPLDSAKAAEPAGPSDTTEITDLPDPGQPANGKVRATPSARRLAREHQIGLSAVQGSGPKGRIKQMDVKNYVALTQAKPPSATPLARKIAQDRGIDLGQIHGTGVNQKIRKADVPETTVPGSKKIKLDGVRKIVAQRMAKSAFTAPHVTLVCEIDGTGMTELRKQLLPKIEQLTGYRLSYSEIILKAVAVSLVSHPRVNASLIDDEIILNDAVHIGLAVALEDGLVVPVVKDVQQKGLAQLTKESKELAAAARTNRLKPEQINGGTFTVSNLGMYAVDAFTPIINQPETAILGVGRLVEKPVGVNGKIELRQMMTLSLSFDHRAIDGAPAAAFLTQLKEVLENPFQLML